MKDADDAAVWGNYDGDNTAILEEREKYEDSAREV
jgi:hypothetical protein